MATCVLAGRPMERLGSQGDATSEPTETLCRTHLLWVARPSFINALSLQCQWSRDGNLVEREQLIPERICACHKQVGMSIIISQRKGKLTTPALSRHLIMASSLR
ncbi:NMDA receptor synaptonuclear signaling and neuronal migration factor [Platysternon megacephalum]|uniref:NMDA receptor synaptonuclear signaling and neuronal migration factor n=1 Tax=Platysternon megacephalum TaxID=55544 RepID=A0A4D9E054_9SAUR|nr:NMDA receptor synaptonuclear signaling and neuronal migration factor [Platysternon megacephalum]